MLLFFYVTIPYCPERTRLWFFRFFISIGSY